MKLWVCLLPVLLAPAAPGEDEKPMRYPDVTEISEAKGWKRRVDITKKGERELLWEYEDAEKYMQASDLNGDGRIDYLSLQTPLHTFNHFAWLDTDHDGYFDKESISHGGKCHMAVPTLGEFAKLDQPFELFEAKGEAHPLLTGAKLWSESSGVGFDLRIRIRYRHYGGKEMVHWTLKTAARDRLSDEEWDKFDEEVTAKERMPYQAWASVILHDETYQTYTLDPEHGAMFLGSLIPIAENSWFEGYSRGKDRREENLYQFDRSPFEHDKGAVTRTHILLNTADSPSPKKVVSQQPFTTQYHSHEDREVWVIYIGDGKYKRHLYRTKWRKGPDAFSSNSYNLKHHLKAAPKESE